MEPGEEVLAFFVAANGETRQLLALDKRAFNGVALAVAVHVVAIPDRGVSRVVALAAGWEYRPSKPRAAYLAARSASRQMDRKALPYLLGQGPVVHGPHRGQRPHGTAERIGEQVPLGAQPAAAAPKGRVCPVSFRTPAAC